jgi:hypothetical protein
MEKVIKALECRLDINGSKYKYCLTCDYRHDIDHCQWACQTDGILEDALALLKAQEPVEPKKNDVELAGLRTWDWACPECNCILIYRANYCSCCGRAVKWE